MINLLRKWTLSLSNRSNNPECMTGFAWFCSTILAIFERKTKITLQSSQLCIQFLFFNSCQNSCSDCCNSSMIEWFWKTLSRFSSLKNVKQILSFSRSDSSELFSAQKMDRSLNCSQIFGKLNLSLYKTKIIMHQNWIKFSLLTAVFKNMEHCEKLIGFTFFDIE